METPSKTGDFAMDPSHPKQGILRWILSHHPKRAATKIDFLESMILYAHYPVALCGIDTNTEVFILTEVESSAAVPAKADNQIDYPRRLSRRRGNHFGAAAE